MENRDVAELSMSGPILHVAFRSSTPFEADGLTARHSRYKRMDRQTARKDGFEVFNRFSTSSALTSALVKEKTTEGS